MRVFVGPGGVDGFQRGFAACTIACLYLGDGNKIARSVAGMGVRILVHESLEFLLRGLGTVLQRTVGFFSSIGVWWLGSRAHLGIERIHGKGEIKRGLLLMVLHIKVAAEGKTDDHGRDQDAADNIDAVMLHPGKSVLSGCCELIFFQAMSNSTAHKYSLNHIQDFCMALHPMNNLLV